MRTQPVITIGVLGALIVLLGLCQFISSDAAAAGASLSEYEIKAALIHKFANYGQWPDESDRTEFRIGILGKDPFGADLSRILDSKSVHEKKIVLLYSEEPSELKSCQIVFISSSEKGRLDQMFSTFKDANILTIGDSQGFAETGGIIGFFEKDQQIHFKVNMATLKETNLFLGARLLRAAKLINK